jgi:hypothetical protein
MTVTMPFDNPFASRYATAVPPAPETLDIYQTHLTDTVDREVVSFWSGDVSSVKVTGTDAKIAIKTAMSRTVGLIPRRTFGWSCDHVLYGGLCGAPKADFEIRVRVTAISVDKSQIEFVDTDLVGPNNYAELILLDDLQFQGGFITSSYAADSRLILKTGTVSGVTYFADLMIPLDKMGVGDVISMFAGCNRSVQVCHSKFNNVENYGGFTFIPTSNPFAVGIQQGDVEEES